MTRDEGDCLGRYLDDDASTTMSRRGRRCIVNELLDRRGFHQRVGPSPRSTICMLTHCRRNWYNKRPACVPVSTWHCRHGGLTRIPSPPRSTSYLSESSAAMCRLVAVFSDTGFLFASNEASFTRHLSIAITCIPDSEQCIRS